MIRNVSREKHQERIVFGWVEGGEVELDFRGNSTVMAAPPGRQWKGAVPGLSWKCWSGRPTSWEKGSVLWHCHHTKCVNSKREEED